MNIAAVIPMQRPYPSTPQERREVDDKLERLIAGQGRMEGTVEALVDKVDDLATKLERIATVQSTNLPRLEAQGERIKSIEDGRAREAVTVQWSDAWRKGVIWGIRAIIIAIIGAGAAGQLGWLEHWLGNRK
jgi:hypothetical protein